MNRTIHVAIGPKLPEFGSWNWLGEGLSANLHFPFVVKQFADSNQPPEADIVVYIKFLPAQQQLAKVARESKVVFFPVDLHGGCHEIDEAYESYRLLSRVIVNSRRLARYFHGYCDITYLDHPLKYALAEPRLTNDDGPLIWIDQECNLQPVLEWVNSRHLKRELWVLSNFVSSSKQLGFAKLGIRTENWTVTRHCEYLKVATAAIDIKGNNFRARHKPPAKAFDYLASGIPVIVNQGSSADLHISRLGFSNLYPETWQSELNSDYRQTVFEFAKGLHEVLGPQIVWHKMRDVLWSMISTDACQHG